MAVMNSQPINNKLKQHRPCIPAWQIEKIQSIIANRWDEVWELVQAREAHRRYLNQSKQIVNRINTFDDNATDTSLNQ